MKLISLNIEGICHFDTVLPFLDREQPDALALMECPEQFLPELDRRGYHFEAVKVRRVTRRGVVADEYNVLATTGPTQFRTHRYYETSEPLTEETYDHSLGRHNVHLGLVQGDLVHNGAMFTILATHFTWAPDGAVATPAQTADLAKLLQFTQDLPPHILCGDFNIPRHHNPLYESLRTRYIDAVPSTYSSSLDKGLHRVGGDPARNHLFTDFMVDYIFTQPPFHANTVRLEFGVSDHAAVVAEVATTIA